MLCVIYHSSLLLSQLLTNLLLRLYHLVVIDDGNPCKFAFVAMCKNLDQNYGILVKRNYQILTVEHFNRFLNKVVTIAIKNR